MYLSCSETSTLSIQGLINNLAPVSLSYISKPYIPHGRRSSVCYLVWAVEGLRTVTNFTCSCALFLYISGIFWSSICHPIFIEMKAVFSPKSPSLKLSRLTNIWQRFAAPADYQFVAKLCSVLQQKKKSKCSVCSAFFWF